MTEYKKADAKAMWVWRLRLVLLAFLPSFLSAFLFEARNIWWLLCTALWVAVFLFFYCIYYPIKYKKFSYKLTDTCLLVHCGVFYTRIRSAYLKNIQYVDCSASPLQQLFHLKTLVVVMAGGVLYLPCLQEKTADQLKALIYPTRP